MNQDFKTITEAALSNFRLPVEMFTLFDETTPFQRDRNGNPVFTLYNLDQMYYMHENNVFIHPDVQITEGFTHTEADLYEMFFFDYPYKLKEFGPTGRFKTNKYAGELYELKPIKMFVDGSLVDYDGSELDQDIVYLYKSCYKINYANFFATHSLPGNQVLNVANFIKNLRDKNGDELRFEDGTRIFYTDNPPTYFENLYENVDIDY